MLWVNLSGREAELNVMIPKNGRRSLKGQIVWGVYPKPKLRLSIFISIPSTAETRPPKIPKNEN
jgi:hypothetical protein